MRKDPVADELRMAFAKVAAAEKREALIEAGVIPKPKMIKYTDFIARLRERE